VIRGEVGGHSVIGVLFGSTLLRRLPTRRVRRPAAILFIGFGLLALAQLVFNGDRLDLF